MRYVSILSPAFSGSTLLSMILCSQPRTIGFGDTYFGPMNNVRNICNCGRRFLECEPRVAIQEAVRNGGKRNFSWETARPVPTPGFWPTKYDKYWPLRKGASIRSLRKIPRKVRTVLFSGFYLETELMLKGLEEIGKYDFYVDGCKVPVRLELLRTFIPDLRVIHMVRHPGAILSRYEKSGEQRQKYRLEQWSRYHRRARMFRSLVGEDRYMAVTYESIVRRPGHFLENVSDFLDMRIASDADPTRLRRLDVHVAGNRTRKSSDSIVDYSNTWREHISSSGLQAAESAVAGEEWTRRLFEES